MPYCVNCGVQLNAGVKRCPLCEVEVVVPSGLPVSASDRNLPQRRDMVPAAFDRSLWIQVVSVLMVIPALLSIVINAAFGAGLSWSLYVVSSLGVVWVWCISPFVYRRNIVPLWLTIDALALLGLLYAVDSLSSGPSWFLPLALPITLWVAALALPIVTLAWKRVLHGLHLMAAVLLAVAVLFIGIEVVVDLYVFDAWRLQWSLIILVVCAPLALVALILSRRQSIVEGMKFWFRV